MNEQSPTSRFLNSLKVDIKRYREYLYPDKDNTLLYDMLTVFNSPGLWTLIHHRFGFWINARMNRKKHFPFKMILKMIYFIGRYLCVFFVKVEISIASDIRPGLYISNKGNIMLGADKIGNNCTIHHNVTLGMGRDRKEPILGDNVWVGHDSILYGGIRIGSNCIIKENTIISRNIPGGVMLGGNPCKMIKKGLSDSIHKIDPEMENRKKECLRS